jgi:hypothetical protein
MGLNGIKRLGRQKCQNSGFSYSLHAAVDGGTAVVPSSGVKSYVWGGSAPAAVCSAPDETVPIAWVAVGDPARILPPERHDEIWSVQEPLNFPQVVYGVERAAGGGVDMQEVTWRVIAGLAEHGNDRVL